MKSTALGMVLTLTCSLLPLHQNVAAEVKPTSSQEAIHKGLNYLQHEAQVWPRENECYSCHNNGDAARVFFRFAREDQLRDLTGWESQLKWLQQPEEWEKASSTDVDLSPSLALIQFGSTALAAAEVNLIDPRGLIETIRHRLIARQHHDGYWNVEPSDHLGSPGTYGNTLATTQALRLLAADKTATSVSAIQRAGNWILQSEPRATIDLAASIIALHIPALEASKEQRIEWQLNLRQRQSMDGGWGPFAGRPSEIFDSSIALLALVQEPNRENNIEALIKGHRYLLETQEAEGGWGETTRPSGGQSYAQHISTSAWALSALLQTHPFLNLNQDTTLPAGR